MARKDKLDKAIEDKKKKFLVDVEERLRYEKKLADDNVAA